MLKAERRAALDASTRAGAAAKPPPSWHRPCTSISASTTMRPLAPRPEAESAAVNGGSPARGRVRHSGFHRRRRFVVRRAVLFLALVAVVVVAAPAAAQQVKLSGPHYQFNIIGSPKGISGDTSNGRSIMVPLKNGTGPDQITCEADQYVLTDDLGPTFTNQVPTGVKLYFQPSTTFEIVDRDATDGAATIKVPVSGDQITFDIYLRVLGKPNTCMDINAYAFDSVQQLYFWAGSVDVNRKTGRSTYVKVNYLFDVWYCEVDTLTGACTAGTTEEVSVFNNVFSSYFWSILNDGTRLVQVRLYPRAR
jgi:hypothetical protein